MGWNQPQVNDTKGLNIKRSRPLRFRGVIAVLSVIIGASIAVYFLLPSRDVPRRTREERKSKRIAEVKPEASHQTKEAAPIPIDPNARPTKVGEKLNGYIMLPDGTLHYIRGEVTNDSRRVKSKWAIFSNPSENVIAGILTMQPGQTLAGRPNFSGKFTQNFLKTLSVPIVVEKDDPPEIAELKRAVTAAKIELKAAYDRGEDIEQIIYKERDACQNLSRYRKELKADVFSYTHKEAVSPEDVDTYVEAANKMLEAKGIAPIALGPLGRIKLRMKENEK